MGSTEGSVELAKKDGIICRDRKKKNSEGIVNEDGNGYPRKANPQRD